MQVVPGYTPLAGGAGPPGPQGPQGPQGNPGVGVPTGGAANNFLLKLSSTAYDTGWGTASDVQTILGLGSAAYASASSFAAASASLTALGSVTPAADTAPYFTSGSAAGTYTLTAFGRSLMDDADASAARTTLGLGSAAVEPASAFAAASASLTALGSLTPAADTLGYYTGATTAGSASLTSAGRALIAGIDAAAQRTTLGLGTAALQPSTAFAAASASLTALGSVTPAADTLAYYTGTTTGGSTSLTSAGRTLIASADAAAQRTALGLGTAATSNTGTSAGQIPVLDSSAQVPAANVAAYASDVWDFQWNASSGTTMEADGWTKTGAITDTATTIGAYTARLLTPTANSGAAYMSKVISGSAPVTGLSIYGSFELRVLCQLPASTSGNITQALAFCMQAGGNQFIVAVTSTAIWASGGTGTLTSLTLTAGLPNRSIWLTIRCANGLTSGTVAGTSYTEVWAGNIRIWTGISTTPWAGFTAGNEGLFRIGRIVGPGSGGNVEAVRVASVYWRAGWNAAPVDYTMRALYGAPGP